VTVWACGADAAAGATTVVTPSSATSAASFIGLRDRRPDVDHVLVLDRHEGRADAHDDVLDLGENVLAGVIFLEADLDLELADGLRRKAVLDEALEQPVSIWDPSCLNLHEFGHETTLAWIQDGANPALG
jgi:hypothetical protein